MDQPWTKSIKPVDQPVDHSRSEAVRLPYLRSNLAAPASRSCHVFESLSGRRPVPPGRATAVDREQNQAIREGAQAKGYEIGLRGDQAGDRRRVSPGRWALIGARTHGSSIATLATDLFKRRIACPLPLHDGSGPKSGSEHAIVDTLHPAQGFMWGPDHAFVACVR